MSTEAAAAPVAKGKKKGNGTTIIIVVVVFVLLVGGGLAYYHWVYKPGKLKGLPTSSAGLTSGQKWNNNGKIEIVP
ncbi:MAG: hypothetical protein ACXVPW_18235 [Bacteroidia bacterium]